LFALKHKISNDWPSTAGLSIRVLRADTALFLDDINRKHREGDGKLQTMMYSHTVTRNLFLCKQLMRMQLLFKVDTVNMQEIST
jgi:hypothetical protein